MAVHGAGLSLCLKAAELRVEVMQQPPPSLRARSGSHVACRWKSAT